MPNRFTVIVPAHNEEAVIPRLLRAVAPLPARSGEMDVIVICNACSDNSAAAAREAMPEARIVDIPQGGKANAINLGLSMCSAYPVFIVDADIVVSFDSLSAAATELADGTAMIAAPALEIECEHSSYLVRAYYRVWQELPYVKEDMVGSGVYGLSEAAARRLGSLPDIIADDSFVRAKFARNERKSVSVSPVGGKAVFVVTAPHDLRSLLRIEARRRAGDAQLRTLSIPQAAQSRTVLGGLFSQLHRPVDLAIYLSIKALGRAGYWINRMRGRHEIWQRDESTR